MIGRYELSFILLLITAKLYSGDLSKRQIDSLNSRAVGYLNEDLDSAQLVSNESYTHAKSISYFYGISKSLSIKARSLDLKGFHNTSHLLYLEALYNLHRSDTTDFYSKFSLLHNLGRTHHIFKQYQLAIDYYDSANTYLTKYIEEFPEIVEEYGERYLPIQLLLDKAENYSLLRNVNAAKKLLFQAERLAMSQNDINMLADTYNQLGLTYFEDDDRKKAREYYLQAISFDASLVVLSKAHHNLAVAYMKDTLFQTAEDYFYQSIEMSKAFTDQSMTYISRLDLGELHALQGNTKKAIEIWEMALESYSMVDNNADHFKIYRYLRDSYRNEDDIAQFDRYLVRFDSISLNYIQLQHETIEKDRAMRFDLLSICQIIS